MAKAKYLTRVETLGSAKSASATSGPKRKPKQTAAQATADLTKSGGKSSAKKPIHRKPASARSVRTFSFEPFDNERLANLNGPFDAHLRSVELKLGAVIRNRGNIYELVGEEVLCRKTEGVLRELYDLTDARILGEEDLFLIFKGVVGERATRVASDADGIQDVQVKTRKGTIRGRGDNQRKYLHQIATNDINFGVGPAGTGKTYLAVAMAVEALETNRVQRLLLVRPAVEAGEKLGFLPGDLIQKVDPYLRPLYDALYEMLGVEKVGRLLERNVIEVAPLAFMRGRTLNDAFILLDEAQNTTVEQMKMFLTRIGFGSTAVITGDMTQVDLPRHIRSGLRHAIAVLKGVEGISLTFFEAADVVRHPLVQRIVMAYERHEDEVAARKAAESGTVSG
jgi:phosphate starvation-inducible protein PhoH and related proteins